MGPEKNLKIGILKNEDPVSHEKWESSCKKFGLDYSIIETSDHDWLENINNNNFDLILLQSPGLTKRFKDLYNERVLIVKDELGIAIYPSYKEILLHENKVFLSYWLKANNLPHPATQVFYKQEEALDFLHRCSFPIVFKTSIGASGRGVRIIHDRKEGSRYINTAFSSDGIRRSLIPNFRMGNFLRRMWVYLNDPDAIKQKAEKIKYIKSDPHFGYVLVQEHIAHDFEWRCVRIGDSFFAHKKIVKREKASGSLKKEYSNPPLELLNFFREFTTESSLFSVSADLFQTDEKSFLINEIQCFFGQSDPYQMLVDNIPGRYLFVNGEWIFEEGDFTSNSCYDLRIEHALSTYQGK